MSAEPPRTASADANLATRPTASLRRRMGAFVYEGVVLFGVLMLAGYLYSAVTQQRNAMVGRAGLQFFLFLVLGIYFAWFWSRSGQTVAMKAWHVRVVRQDGTPLSQAQALVRYLLAWLWLLPGLVFAWLMHWERGWLYVALLANVGLFAALARWIPDRQFLHDRWCRTRLVAWDARTDGIAPRFSTSS